MALAWPTELWEMTWNLKLHPQQPGLHLHLHLYPEPLSISVLSKPSSAAPNESVRPLTGRTGEGWLLGWLGER